MPGEPYAVPRCCGGEYSGLERFEFPGTDGTVVSPKYLRVISRSGFNNASPGDYAPSLLGRHRPLTGLEQRFSNRFHANSLWGRRAIRADSHTGTYMQQTIVRWKPEVVGMEEGHLGYRDVGDHWIGLDVID